MSPRTWLAYIHHTAGLVIGLVAGVLAISFLALSVAGLPLMLIGIPILGLTMRGAGRFARFERARFGFFLGARIAPWPAAARAGYRWGLVPRQGKLTERATWGALGCALARLPVSVVMFAVIVLAWSLGLVMITLPLYNGALPAGGAHPPVLTDRGLDAALSGLAARCPVPVEVHVDVPVRPKASVEAVAYFVVAEALTNVAKYSRAAHANVVVEGHGYPGNLSIVISDDGIGADPAGAGLSGLAGRVAGVDGTLTVESPSGGPTIISAVLPCG